MQETEIRLALADDHRLLRQAFRIALSSFKHIQVLFEVGSGLELISNLSRQHPDVILLDLKMPGMNGIETLKIIHRDFPNIRVLILSAFLDYVYVAKCLEYGINGYLTKDMDLNEIIIAIQNAYKNKVYYTNLLRDTYFKNHITHFNKKGSNGLPSFSEVEIQIIQLLRKEKNTEEIANTLFLSKRSIEIKRERIKEKAQVKTIGGLLIYCLKRGLID